MLFFGLLLGRPFYPFLTTATVTILPKLFHFNFFDSFCVRILSRERLGDLFDEKPQLIVTLAKAGFITEFIY